tara:strand:- start:375 stop:785 length:411 start_codon:yes stop_codon:yes gene_type:complete
MEKIYSKTNKDLLLHIINRKEDIVGRTNVVPEHQFLQLATLDFPKGTTFKPHKHIWKSPSFEKTIAQESWIVISGKVKCIFYDIDDTLLGEWILNPGDCSMTFEGGHTYEILEDNTLVYEYKTGPYTGVENDKRFI